VAVRRMMELSGVAIVLNLVSVATARVSSSSSALSFKTGGTKKPANDLALR
jgi:hypothetical protein